MKECIIRHDALRQDRIPTHRGPATAHHHPVGAHRVDQETQAGLTVRAGALKSTRLSLANA